MLRWKFGFALTTLIVGLGTAAAQGPAPPGAPQYPPFEKVIEGFDKVNSDADGEPPLYGLFVRRRDGAVLAAIPGGPMLENNRYFIGLTISGGEAFAGLQSGDHYVRWKQVDNKLVLLEPQIETRSTGDAESKRSVDRLYTDKVLLDVPVQTMMFGRDPVIDLKGLLLGNLTKFFGGRAGGANLGLATLKKLKAFPKNIEVAYEVPVNDGRLKTFHFSIKLVPENTGYRPREADPRVGYFTTGFTDFGKYTGSETRTRFINRWHLEKKDPSLKVSPPKKAIVFYIEHTTPVRYRRWVRQGILYWNKAFEKVGIVNAIEVRQQDPDLPKEDSHMDKDPEDVRWNFIRWLNNGVGTAIGPSRVHPLTGEILDADIILTDGWIRHFQTEYNELLPQTAMEGFCPETLAWLDNRPSWDPRFRLIPPTQRSQLVRQRISLRNDPLAQSLPANVAAHKGAMCIAANHMSLELDLLRMTLDLREAEAQAPGPKPGDPKPGTAPKPDAPKVDPKPEPKPEPKPDVEKLDGIPADYIGPLLADLVAHEVGHTLGLRHNFKASSLYTMAQINGEELKGKKPLAGSVMDYIGVNINLNDGKVQGDWSMIDIGPYDLWAIEYGYTLESNLKPILDRVAEPELVYATDEDTIGPDPLARRYDFSKNPLEFAESRMRLVKHHRDRLLDKFVKDGESWSKARRGYMMTLNIQTQMVSMMANWVGGAHVNRDRKGDPKGRTPLEVVPAAQQRAALDFVIKSSFRDESFGLTPDLLRRFGDDKWDDGNFFSMDTDGAAWPIHDRILGIQSSALTMLMNPRTLRRVYDNEFRVPSKDDAVTLPELLEKVSSAVWTELDQKPQGQFTARQPMISSLRRNLQREHLERLIDLIMPNAGSSAAYKPIANLASMQLRQIQGKIANALAAGNADPYTRAHLQDAEQKIKKGLEAQLVYDVNGGRGGFGGSFLIFGEDKQHQNAIPGQTSPSMRDAQGQGFWMLHPAGCRCGEHPAGN